VAAAIAYCAFRSRWQKSVLPQGRIQTTHVKDSRPQELEDIQPPNRLYAGMHPHELEHIQAPTELYTRMHPQYESYDGEYIANT
jgi:hypothetical protein